MTAVVRAVRGECERWQPVGRARWRPRRRSGCRKKREVAVPGQLALVLETETVVAAAVWEALPPERQVEVALRLARLAARLVEAVRDE